MKETTIPTDHCDVEKNPDNIVLKKEVAVAIDKPMSGNSLQKLLSENACRFQNLYYETVGCFTEKRKSSRSPIKSVSNLLGEHQQWQQIPPVFGGAVAVAAGVISLHFGGELVIEVASSSSPSFSLS